MGGVELLLEGLFGELVKEGLAHPIRRLLQRRVEDAREILMNELRGGDALSVEIEDIVSD